MELYQTRHNLSKLSKSFIKYFLQNFFFPSPSADKVSSGGGVASNNIGLGSFVPCLGLAFTSLV